MKSEIQDLRNDYAALQGEVGGLREEVRELRQDNDELRAVNSKTEERLSEMERKADDLENRSKRNNLIIYGLERNEGETSEDCEGILQDLITDKLEMAGDVVFDRVHRLNSKADSPLITRCASYKDKLQILRAKRKLHGSQISIGEDFSRRVREIRRNLVPRLKQARDEQKKATLTFDHLYIEGKKFTFDLQKNTVIEMR
ncbi:unconventional myosin-XVIIIa-like [Littorina saxatilis]|uniref:unconventional myosin-XVIIIa-like n=1 Tax=Littorina saxatilis TaxID=31220 RepID=UPI0038B5390D